MKELETFQVRSEVQPVEEEFRRPPQEGKGEGGSNTKKLIAENVWKILGQQKYRYIPMPMRVKKPISWLVFPFCNSEMA